MDSESDDMVKKNVPDDDVFSLDDDVVLEDLPIRPWLQVLTRIIPFLHQNSMLAILSPTRREAIIDKILYFAIPDKNKRSVDGLPVPCIKPCRPTTVAISKTGMTWKMLMSLYDSSISNWPWFTILLLLSIPPTRELISGVRKVVVLAHTDMQSVEDKSTRQSFEQHLQSTIDFTINPPKWKNVVTFIVHPDKHRETGEEDVATAILQRWNLFLEPHVPKIIQVEPPLYESNNPWDSWSADDLTGYGFCHPIHGLILVTRIDSGCFAIHTQDHVRADRLPKNDDINLYLSLYTCNLINDDRHHPYSGANLIEMTFLDNLEQKIEVPFPAVESAPYSPPMLMWMMRPQLPAIRNHCWLASVCALCTCSVLFMSHVQNVTKVTGMKRIRQMDLGDAFIQLVGQIEVILHNETTGMSRRTKRMNERDNPTVFALMQRLMVVCPDPNDLKSNEHKNDMRVVISTMATSLPESPICQILRGISSKFGHCVSTSPQMINNTVQHDTQFIISVGLGINNLDSIGQLVIGSTERRETCILCNDNHSMSTKTVWLLQPPEELIAVAFEEISTRIDFNPCVIKYEWCELETGHLNSDVKTATYTIAAMGIATPGHQLVAVPVPGYGNVPIQWTILDSSAHQFPQTQCVTESLPNGKICSLLLRRCDPSDSQGLPSPDVDTTTVVHFARTLVLIAPPASCLRKDWTPNLFPLAWGQERATLTIRSCLALRNGCIPDCSTHDCSTHGDEITHSKSVWVLLRVVNPEPKHRVVSKRTHYIRVESIKRNDHNVSRADITYMEASGNEYDRPIRPDTFSYPRNPVIPPGQPDAGRLDNNKFIHHQGTDTWTLKVARLSLESIAPRGSHVYSLDFMGTVPDPTTGRDRVSFSDLRLPRGYLTVQKVDDTDVQNAARYLLNQHSTLVEYIACLSN
jgi:hypothetical protein